MRAYTRVLRSKQVAKRPPLSLYLFPCICDERYISVFCPRPIASRKKQRRTEFHTVRMLNSLWRAYSQKCREDFYDDLGKANTNRQMLQLMINKDLLNSAEERKRISETGDKPAIVTQFEKEFKEKTGEISRLLSSTRRLSFK